MRIKKNRNYLVGSAWQALGKLSLRCERASCPPTPLLLHGAGAIKAQLSSIKALFKDAILRLY